MATATRRPTTISLREQVRDFLRASAVSTAIDREAGFIRDVRVLGLDSDNGRRYLSEAVRAAIPLYEGRKVKINHPLRPNESRPVQSVFGWLEGIYQGKDGALYTSKLHFLKSHEMAEAVCEAAERNPALFSLSHNAEGRGHYENGVFVVEEITEVRSVDIVDDGATNKSLFESTSMGLTLSQLIASSKVQERLKKKLLEMGAVCEDGETPLGDSPVAPTTGDADTGPDWKTDLVSAIGKLVQSDDPEQHAMGLKIMKLLKPEAAVEESDEDGQDEDDNNANSMSQESKKPRKRPPNIELLSESRALTLCKAAGVETTAEVLEAMVGLDLDKGLALLGLVKKYTPPAREPILPSSPRSSGPRVPVTEGVVPRDSKGWAERLLK